MAQSQTNRDVDRQSDLAVMGVDEYKQKRKLERILDDLHAVGDKSRESWDKYVKGEIDAHAKNVVMARVVKEAIRDCETMLRDYADEAGEGADEYWKGDPENPVGKIPQHRQDDITITGLEDFLRLNEIWFEEWIESVKRRNQPRKPVKRQIKHTIPEDVSRDAAARLALYLSRERGIELATEQKEVEVHAEPW